MVIDPHEPGVTTKARQASIRLDKGTLSSGAVFTIPGSAATGFALKQGCVMVLADGTDAMKRRFVNVALNRWIPEPIVLTLFDELGISVRSPSDPNIIDPNNLPVITDTDRADCTTDPENPGPLANVDGPSTPGVLSFQAVVQFKVPQ